MTDETETKTQTKPAPGSDVKTAAERSSAWAEPVPKVRLSHIPEGAMHVNVEGRRLSGPLQGFGPLWQKTYSIRLEGVEVSPQDVIRTWKEHFPEFWPPQNHFYAPLAGIQPGEVALINSSLPGGMPLSTGVLVIYSDEESFTLMTTQGHPFSGWVTFSARKEEDGVTVAQAQVLMRANDPVYEIGMRLGGHRQEDRLWQHTLGSVAGHFGVTGEVQTERVCVDRKLQWRRARNLWHNAGMRSTMYLVASPAIRARQAVRGSRRG